MGYGNDDKVYTQRLMPKLARAPQVKSSGLLVGRLRDQLSSRSHGVVKECCRLSFLLEERFREALDDGH